MEVLRVAMLINLRVASLLGKKVVLLLWGDAARNVWRLVCEVAPFLLLPWMHLVSVTPDDLPHPNRVAFATSAGVVSSARRAIANAANYLRQFGAPQLLQMDRAVQRQFYAQLVCLHSSYDPAIAVRQLAQHVRNAAGLLRRESAAIAAQMRRILHIDDSEKVNLQRPAVQFLLQFFLESLVAGDWSQTWSAFPAAPKEKAAAPLSTPSVSAPVAILYRKHVSAFERQCVQLFLAQLALPVNVSAANFVGNVSGYKRLVGRAFTQSARMHLFGLWKQRKERNCDVLSQIFGSGVAKYVQEHGPSCTKQQTANFAAFEFSFVDNGCGMPAEAPVSSVSRLSTKSSVSTSQDSRLKFTPKVPKVTTVPNVDLSIGHIAFTPIVAMEAIGRTLRAFVHASSLATLGLTSEQAAAIGVAAYCEAYERERQHFSLGKALTTKFERHLQLLLERKGDDWRFVVNSVGNKSEFLTSCTPQLALFDFAALVSPQHKGSFHATSDGVCVHLVAVVEGSGKSKAKKEEPKKVRTAADMEAFDRGDIMGCGIDCGKHGIEVVVPPVAAQGHAAKLAFAEAQLSQLQSQLDLSPKDQQLEREVVVLQQRVDALKLEKHEAINVIYGPGRRAIERGASSITKQSYASEMRSNAQKREREESLAKFDLCVQDGARHGNLLKRRQKLQQVPVGLSNEVMALQQRLADFSLLCCAYNAPAVRKQRREREILHQQYVARCVRLITNDLPSRVKDAGLGFPLHGSSFPARSQVARQSATIRGWERGVHVARARIAEAETQESQQRYAAVRSHPPRLIIAIDMCPGKGQRASSGFPFRRLMKDIIQYVRVRAHLHARVEFQVINGQHFRSSKQAAGFVSWLSKDGQRVDNERVQPQHLPDSWKGPRPRDFYTKFDPVTGTIKLRDPPAALTVSRNAIAEFFGAPNPSFLRR